MVDVLNRDSTDPSALARNRDTNTGRDTTQSATTPPPAPVPVPNDVSAVLPPIESVSPGPVNEPIDASTNPLIPRVYPNIPAHIVPPQPLNLSAVTGDQAQLDQILRQSGTFALQDEVQLNNQLSGLLNSGVPFGPNVPVYKEPDIQVPDNPYPQLIEDAVQYRARQAASQLSPVGVNPNTGQVTPGVRNALAGNPLSRTLRELPGRADRLLYGELGNEFEESLPDNILINSPLSIFRFGLAARDFASGLGEAFKTNQGRRFLRNIAATPGARGFSRIPTADRFTSNLGTIASRIVDPTSELAQRPIDTGDPTFVGSLAENSLTARDLFTGLDTSQFNGPSTNPLQGRFGDFGNAGVLSLLLYAANLPEGIASGALYELTNFAIDNFTSQELSPDRVTILDAFRGRDLGFMQEADDARYLSFMGEDGVLSHIGIRNPVAQGAIGFVTDVIWGGFTDVGLSNALRAGRRGLDTAVARALPDTTPANVRILNQIVNQEPGSAVLNINRALDEAVAASRLDPLPRRLPDNINSVVNRGSRSLSITADGIPINVRVARLGDLVTQATPTVPRSPLQSALQEVQANRLAVVEQEIIQSQEGINRNLQTIVDSQEVLNQFPGTENLPEFIDTQLALIRNSENINESLNRQLSSLLVERRQLSQNLGNLSQVVSREVNEAVARGTTLLDGNVITTLANDNALDSSIPLIPRLSIEPSTPAPTILQQYRIDPTNVQPLQLVPVRRTDEQLTELAKFHQVIPVDSPTLNPQQILALRSVHPTLLARYGNPIDDNLASPVKRVVLNEANPVVVDPQRSFIPDVPVTSTGVRELPVLSKRTVNSLSRRYDRVLQKLDNTPDIPTQDRLLRQLENINRRIDQVIASSDPQSVQDLYVSSLPTNRAPLSTQSQETARLLASAESQFRESTSAARELHRQLIDAEQIIEEQGRILDELPPIERQSLHNEVATRNNYNDNGGVPLITSRQATEPIEQLPRTPTTDPPANIIQHIESEGLWYHGTKSRVDNLAQINYSRGSSVSNELGPGLYLTTDPDLAQVFAKAHPATDRIPNPALRQSNVGDVHQVLAQPGGREIINGDIVVPQDSPIRSLFHELVKDELSRTLSPDLANRLLTNVRRITRTKPYRDWFQSLRVNWNRLRPDSQTELVRFNGLFTEQLGDQGIFGASHRHADGHFTLAVYNDTSPNPLGLQDIARVSIGSGSLEEQRLSRYAADLFAHSEFNTQTTRANLAASALSVDRQTVDNLKTAVKQAYRQSLDDTDQMLRIDRQLQDTVEAETKQRLADIERTAPDGASNQLRRFRGENNSPCI